MDLVLAFLYACRYEQHKCSKHAIKLVFFLILFSIFGFSLFFRHAQETHGFLNGVYLRVQFKECLKTKQTNKRASFILLVIFL